MLTAAWVIGDQVAAIGCQPTGDDFETNVVRRKMKLAEVVFLNGDADINPRGRKTVNDPIAPFNEGD